MGINHYIYNINNHKGANIYLRKGTTMDTTLIRLNLGITKVYLIPYSEGYMLIDTGYKNDYKKFRNLLGKNNIDILDIKYLLLTHHHNDHVGFAQLLKDKHKVKLVVQKASIPLLAKGYNSLSEIGAPVNGFVGIIIKAFSVFQRDSTYPPVILTEEDMVIDGDDNTLLYSLGIKGKIISTLGHTSDSMAVVMDNGNTFCGDAAMNFMMAAGTKHRPILIINTTQVYKSWEKIKGSGAKTIYPSHGNPFPATNLTLPI